MSPSAKMDLKCTRLIRHAALYIKSIRHKLIKFKSSVLPEPDISGVYWIDPAPPAR